jgi:hypothetical protein
MRHQERAVRCTAPFFVLDNQSPMATGVMHTQKRGVRCSGLGCAVLGVGPSCSGMVSTHFRDVDAYCCDAYCCDDASMRAFCLYQFCTSGFPPPPLHLCAPPSLMIGSLHGATTLQAAEVLQQLDSNRHLASRTGHRIYNPRLLCQPLLPAR